MRKGKRDNKIITSCINIRVFSISSIFSPRFFLFLSLLSVLFLFNSCYRFISTFKPHSGVVVLHSVKPDTVSVKRIAVIPFRTGSLNPVENGTVICHLTGQSFKSGKLEVNAGENVASLFYNVLLRNKSINLISETDVNLIYQFMDNDLEHKYDFSLGKMTGKTLNADAVLMGVVIRYEERDGTSWAANKPASAAFTAVLIDVRSGEVLWKIRFDKTQQALSENVLNIRNFLRGGGGWQTVEQLLLIGIEDALKSFPIQ
jgi:hypothetical protein